VYRKKPKNNRTTKLKFVVILRDLDQNLNLTMVLVLRGRSC